MIKNLLSISLIVSCFSVSAQSFTATYDFAATTTVSGTTDPTAPPTITGITCGSFVAVGTPSANPNAGGRFSFVGWPLGASNGATSVSTMTGSINFAQYYEVTLSYNITGSSFAIDSIIFNGRRSSTGVRNWAVRSSEDNYAANMQASALPAFTNSLSVVNSNEFFVVPDVDINVGSSANGNPNSKVVLSQPIINSQSITFRFYGWNAEAASGTFGIDNVSFYGRTLLTTSISENENLLSSTNIYPVPSNDGMVYIESKADLNASKIEVIDVLGNVVLLGADKTDSKMKLNLTNMPNGNYFVRIYSNNGVATKKISIIK